MERHVVSLILLLLTTDIHWIRGWMGPGVDPDVVVKGRIVSAGNRKPIDKIVAAVSQLQHYMRLDTNIKTLGFVSQMEGCCTRSCLPVSLKL
jgi:hypothetical protein